MTRPAGGRGGGRQPARPRPRTTAPGQAHQAYRRREDRPPEFRTGIRPRRPAPRPAPAPPPPVQHQPQPGQLEPYQLAERIPLRSPDGPLAARLPAPSEVPYPPERRDDRPRRLTRLVEAYGWRAYAIPVLIVATFLTLMDVARSQSSGSSRTATVPLPPGATRDPQIYVELPGDPGGQVNPRVAPTALPAGRPYTQEGAGTFHVVPGESLVYGTGPLKRYTVEVEDGISVDDEAFAADVERILADQRGWGADGRMSFQRIDNPNSAVFRVTLTSSMTVRRYCGYDIRAETSCFNGPENRAIINDARWVRGAVAFNGDLLMYHQYVISHEVGHGLGRHQHELCPGKGQLAPTMMQQTLGTGDCTPNPWPFPDGKHEHRGPLIPQ